MPTSRRSRRTRHVAAYAVLGLVVLACAGLAYVEIRPKESSAASNTRTVAVTTGTVSQTVEASGNLEYATSTAVDFATSGTLTEVDVQPGQTVQAGQVLGKVDPASAQNALTIAQLNYTSAAQKYTSATSSSSSGASTTGASTATGSGSSGTGAASQSGTDVAGAQVALLQAQESLTEAQAALAATTLTAPTGGLVLSVNGTVGSSTGTAGSSSSGSGSSGAGATGSTATTGGSGAGGAITGSTSSTSSSSSAFVTLVDPSSYTVTVAFPESDAIKIKAGQPVTVTVDALSGTELTGTVASISPTATVSSNVVTYRSVITVAHPPDTLKAGMTVTATVTTESKANVVSVPTAAIQTQGTQRFVMRSVNGQEERTAVQVGIQGDSSTEITSGLAAGDEVVISTGSITSTATGSSTGQSGTLGGTGAATGAGGFPGGASTGGQRTTGR